MSATVFLTLAACLALGADQDSAEVKAELMRLQGEWNTVRAEREGVDVKTQDAIVREFSIKGNQTFTQYKKEERISTFEIDPTVEPKTIDFLTKDGKGDTIRGIYELDGDKFLLLVARAGGPRPKSFKDKNLGLYYEHERKKK